MLFNTQFSSYPSLRRSETYPKLIILLGLIKVQDLNVQIEALNKVLGKLDDQIRNNLQELSFVRLPEAKEAVFKSKLRQNNVLITAASISAGGQILRQIAATWRLQKVTYPTILSMAARFSAGGSYAFTRLVQLENLKTECDTLSQVISNKPFSVLFRLEEIFGFLPKVSSPYFVQDPLKYLSPSSVPKVLIVRARLLGIKLKADLSCLIFQDLDASSDLSRAVDNLIDVLIRRLQKTDALLRLIVMRNDLLEPVHFLWYN